MTDNICPTEAELLAFADADLSPQRLARVEKHLELCGACARQVMALSALMADLAAPVGPARLDVADHVAAVMKRLDEPARPHTRPRWIAWGGALAGAAAAAAALTLTLRGVGPEALPGTLTARGGPAETALARDVGVQLYALDPSPRALEAGGPLRVNTPLTAGLRNLGAERAYLLLFAVDANEVVHWIAPRYTDPGTDPQAALVPPSTDERLLSSAAVFDDLTPGRLRLLAVITRSATRVSEVEKLSASELSRTGLLARFPGAEIRELVLEAAPQGEP